MKHLLRVFQELVPKEIELLDIGLADGHFVPTEHCERLVLQIKQLRADVAELMYDTRVLCLAYWIESLKAMLEALPA